MATIVTWATTVAVGSRRRDENTKTDSQIPATIWAQRNKRRSVDMDQTPSEPFATTGNRAVWPGAMPDMIEDAAPAAMGSLQGFDRVVGEAPDARPMPAAPALARAGFTQAFCMSGSPLAM